MNAPGRPGWGLAAPIWGWGSGTRPIRALEQVMNWYPACDCFGDAWLTRARLASAQGAPAAARRVYRTFGPAITPTTRSPPKPSG